MKTLDIEEAAEFLKISQYKAREMASAGKLPAAKIGKRWVFSQSDLEEHLTNEIRQQTAAVRGESCSPTNRPGRKQRAIPNIHGAR